MESLPAGGPAAWSAQGRVVERTRSWTNRARRLLIRWEKSANSSSRSGDEGL